MSKKKETDKPKFIEHSTPVVSKSENLWVDTLDIDSLKLVRIRYGNWPGLPVLVLTTDLLPNLIEQLQEVKKKILSVERIEDDEQ